MAQRETTGNRYTKMFMPAPAVTKPPVPHKLPIKFNRPSPVMMPATAVVDEVMEKIKSMTLLEASELVKQIEVTFDVDASAGGGGGMMMAPVAGAAGAGGAEAAVEEKKAFNVELTGFDAASKIKLIKLVRAELGLGLKEAKETIESTPKVLKEDLSKEDAEAFKAANEENGGEVKLV